MLPRALEVKLYKHTKYGQNGRVPDIRICF